MKKKSNGGFLCKGNRTSKWSKIMRISFVLLVAVFMQVSAASYSQSRKVNLKAGKMSLPELFKMIQEQSDFDFFYQPDAVSEDMKVSFGTQQLDVVEVLDKALQGTGLDFKIIDTDIVILPRKKSNTYNANDSGIQQANGQVRGTVLDITGLPIPGVNVIVKGTTNGTITNIDGVYELSNVPEDAVIEFRFVGFEGQEITVSGRSTIDITLIEEVKGLDEVVVVGYGSMERKQITSAVSSINTDELPKVAATSPVQQLQGRIAGLNISKPSGSDPNASPDILIRGMTSIQGGSPLIIVDGVVVGSMDIVSPEDIESFSVLKDGSAAAIYGSRGTNGVILITTKGGSKDKTTVEYSGYYAFDKVSDRPDMLTADEFRALGEVMAVDREVLGTASTDWYEELLQPNHNMVHNLAFSGGNEKSNYRASIDYMDNEGIALKSFKKRLNGRINVNHKAINDKLNVKLSLSASQAKYRGADYGAFGNAAKFNPTKPIYDENGDYQTFADFGLDNPIGNINTLSQENIRKVVLANIFAEYELLDGLKVGGRAAWKVEDRNTGEYISSKRESFIESEIEGQASTSSFYSYRYTYEANASYRKRIAKHDISLMGNFTQENDLWYTYNMTNAGFVNDKFLWHAIGTGMKIQNPRDDEGNPTVRGEASMGSDRFEKTLQSWRGRLVYSYDDKYMLTVSYNREGSSIYGRENKWGDFYGISGGWTLTEEHFMEALPLVNYLKLRVGYGETGNAASGPYYSLSTVKQEGLPYIFNGVLTNAYALERNPNPNLAWERKAEVNLGIDYAVWNNRLDGAIDIYSRKTEGMLYDAAAPVPALIKPTIRSNIGEVSNKGIEFSLNAQIFKNTALKWYSNFNISYDVNKVEKLSNNNEDPVPFYEGALPGNGLGYAYRIKEGGSIGDFYGARFEGFTEDGEWIFMDLNDEVEGYHADTDREVIGNGMPNYFVGLTNRVEYKNFDLEIFMRGAFDYQILNVGRIYMENITKFPQSNIYTSAINSPLRAPSQYSDYYLEDGDYLKIENIALGYTFNTSNLKYISYARLYASCSNVYTFTNYSGMSPELGGHAGLTPGFDNMNFYPVTRTFTLGAIIKF